MRSERPPVPFVFVMYAISMVFPFTLSTAPKYLEAGLDASIAAAARGARLGMGALALVNIAIFPAVSLQFSADPSLFVGFALVLFGSTAIPSMATAKSYLPRLLNIESRSALKQRLPFSGGDLLLLGVTFTTTRPPSNISISRVLNSLIPFVIGPLVLGWILVFKSTGLYYLLLPIVFYLLLLLITRRRIMVSVRGRQTDVKEALKGLMLGPKASPLISFGSTVILVVLIGVLVLVNLT